VIVVQAVQVGAHVIDPLVDAGQWPRCRTFGTAQPSCSLAPRAGI